jgi:hypothetical protein
MKNETIAASATIKTVTATPIPTRPPTSKPNPVPTPHYVTIEPVFKEPNTSPKSNRNLFEKPAPPPGISYDSIENITIFEKNQMQNLDNSYKSSFDLKNPPMVIRYKVVPIILLM